MTRSSARRSRDLPFGRRLAISMTAAALLPILLFGTFVIGRIDSVLGGAAEARVVEGLDAVDSVIARREQALADTTSAYAGWAVLRDLIDRGELPTIQSDVLGFLEGRGSVDAAIAEVDGRLLTAGGDADHARLAEAARSLPGSTGVVTVDGGMYLVASVPIAAGAGADPGTTDHLVLADRLDGAFIQEIRRLTGFDVAILAPNGSIAVAGDPGAAAAFAGQATTTQGTSRDGEWVAGWRMPEPDRADVGRVLLTTRLATTQAVIGQLPAFLVVTLVAAAVLSVIVAMIMSRGLNLRLAVIHDGLTAVAAGRRPAVAPTEGSPDIERLAVALDALVEATERRERILRDASVSLAELHPDLGVTAVADAAVTTAIDVFGLVSCSIVRSDGTVITQAPAGNGADPRPSSDRRLEAPLGSPTEDADALVVVVPADVPWTEADVALVEMYARLVGGILRDARSHDETTDRLERLGRLNDLQREFLRSVSHNLQTPLTTISLVADDLVENDPSASPEVRTRQVRAIRAQAARLERLVAQIITVSRLDAGRLHLERDAVAIAPLVRRVWSSLDSGRDLRIEADAGDLLALGDRESIEQIVWILLDNAVRYAPAGPIVARTSADEDGATTRIRIEIRDAGPGVPEGERRSIFRRFWSGAAGRSRGGTGIGLDIARRLARAMDGSLRFEPNEPFGSVFVLTLPAELALPD